MLSGLCTQHKLCSRRVICDCLAQHKPARPPPTFAWPQKLRLPASQNADRRLPGIACKLRPSVDDYWAWPCKLHTLQGLQCHALCYCVSQVSRACVCVCVCCRAGVSGASNTPPSPSCYARGAPCCWPGAGPVQPHHASTSRHHLDISQLSVIPSALLLPTDAPY